MTQQKIIELIAAVKSFSDMFDNMNNAWSTGDDVLSELESNCLYPFKESFDEVNAKVDNWATAVQAELSRYYIDPKIEKMRVIATQYAQMVDPNGCHSDANTLLEYGEAMEYEAALGYYMWYANTDITESDAVCDYEEAVKLVKEAGMYDESLRVLEMMADMDDPSEHMKFLVKNSISDMIREQKEVNALVEFEYLFNKTANELMDAICDEKRIECPKVKLSIGDKEVSVDLDADVYESISCIIKNKMKEANK